MTRKVLQVRLTRTDIPRLGLVLYFKMGNSFDLLKQCGEPDLKVEIYH